MQNLVDAIGLVAATTTSLSYIPQVEKALRRGSTNDLSSRTAYCDAAAWAYGSSTGLLKGDYVIVLADAVGFSLVAALLSSMAGSFLSSDNVPEGRRRPF